MYGIDIKIDKLQSHENSAEHVAELLQDCANALKDISTSKEILKELLKGTEWPWETESSVLNISLLF